MSACACLPGRPRGCERGWTDPSDRCARFLLGWVTRAALVLASMTVRGRREVRIRAGESASSKFDDWASARSVLPNHQDWVTTAHPLTRHAPPANSTGG